MRLLADDTAMVAVTHAWRLVDWQRAVRLPGEQGLQGLMLTSEVVTMLANSYYAVVHFPLTAGS